MGTGSSRPAETARRWRLGRALTYDRQVALALLVVAILPLATFGLVAFSRFTAAVRSEADDGIRNAAASVVLLLDQAGSRLATTATSYATWDRLIGSVDALDAERVQAEVADFLVGRGTADAVSVVDGPALVVQGGPAADAAALLEVQRASLAAPDPGGPGNARLVQLPSGVHLVSVQPISLEGREGPGAAAAADGGAAIALARRIDGGVALDAARLSGFDVAVYGSNGSLQVATDTTAAEAIGSPDPAALAEGTVLVAERDGYASGSVPLVGASGERVGARMVTAPLGVLGAVDRELLPILGFTLALTTAGAALLAILLARGLRRRLVAVEGGMAAVAGGDMSVRLAADGGGELDRLVASQNRLAATLGRREETLRASVAAVEGLTPDRAVEDLAAAGARAAVSVFRLPSVRILAPDGRVVAQAFHAASSGAEADPARAAGGHTGGIDPGAAGADGAGAANAEVVTAATAATGAEPIRAPLTRPARDGRSRRRDPRASGRTGMRPCSCCTPASSGRRSATPSCTRRRRRGPRSSSASTASRATSCGA